MEYYSGIKKNEIIQFVATWLDLEIIILIDYHTKSDTDRCHISLITGI